MPYLLCCSLLRSGTMTEIYITTAFEKNKRKKEKIEKKQRAKKLLNTCDIKK